MRKKLIGVLDDLPVDDEWYGNEEIADHLLANDVVKVVRCKDCKHWNCWRNSGEGSGDCLLDEGYVTLATQHYDFCSHGERKDYA